MSLFAEMYMRLLLFFFFCLCPGGYAAAVVVNGGRKEVAGVFIDSRGKVLKAELIFSFKGNAYEPNIFFDSKRNEFYFTCTVESGGIAKADFNLQSGLNTIVLTKKSATGGHASNTDTAKTKNFVGYTNKMLARTSGYYNKLIDRYVSARMEPSLTLSHSQPLGVRSGAQPGFLTGGSRLKSH